MKIVWSSVAWKDFSEVASDETKQGINVIIDDIMNLNGKGIGRPVDLRGPFMGWLTRRVDRTNRLVYRIKDGQLEIAMCLYHR